jgi:hypothetical protein
MRHLPPSATASLLVLRRFAIRLGCIGILSTAYHGPQDSAWETFSYLSLLTAACCAAAAMTVQEPKFGRSLTNWDEAAAFAIIALVARAVPLG